VQFIRPASAGEIIIDVETVRSGRSVSFLRTTVTQNDRPVLTASAVAATTRDGFEFSEIRPPAIPPHPPADRARFNGPEPGLHFTQLDLTLEPGLSIFGNHERARAAGWISPPEPDTTITLPWLVCAADFIPPTMDFRTDHPSGAATIELDVQLLRADPGDAVPAGNPITANITCNISADGFCIEDGTYWTPDRQLLATSRQLRLAGH